MSRSCRYPAGHSDETRLRGGAYGAGAGSYRSQPADCLGQDHVLIAKKGRVLELRRERPMRACARPGPALDAHRGRCRVQTQFASQHSESLPPDKKLIVRCDSNGRPISNPSIEENGREAQVARLSTERPLRFVSPVARCLPPGGERSRYLHDGALQTETVAALAGYKAADVIGSLKTLIRAQPTLDKQMWESVVAEDGRYEDLCNFLQRELQASSPQTLPHALSNSVGVVSPSIPSLASTVGSTRAVGGTIR